MLSNVNPPSYSVFYFFSGDFFLEFSYDSIQTVQFILQSKCAKRHLFLCYKSFKRTMINVSTYEALRIAARNGSVPKNIFLGNFAREISQERQVDTFLRGKRKRYNFASHKKICYKNTYLIVISWPWWSQMYSDILACCVLLKGSFESKLYSCMYKNDPTVHLCKI